MNHKKNFQRELFKEVAVVLCNAKFAEPVNCAESSNNQSEYLSCVQVTEIASDVSEKCSKWVVNNEEKCTELIRNSSKEKKTPKKGGKKRGNKKNKENI